MKDIWEHIETFLAENALPMLVALNAGATLVEIAEWDCCSHPRSAPEFSLALQLKINVPVSTFHPYQQKLE
jgi:hypothetical protein